jgi:transposase
VFFKFEEYSYYICISPTDMRKGYNSLAQIVCEALSLDPFSKSMFLFCSRRRNIVKVLVWDRGFWVLQKRLQKGTFKWPQEEGEAKQVTLDDLKRLLDGQDVFRRLEPFEGTWVF